MLGLTTVRPFVEPRLRTELRVETWPHPGGQVTLLADEHWLFHEGPVGRQFLPVAEHVAASKRLRSFYAAVDRLVDEVRPFLAVWPAEGPVEELSTFEEDAASLLLAEGWVDVGRLTDGRREKLERLLGDARVATQVGWRWWPVSERCAQEIGAVLARRP